MYEIMKTVIESGNYKLEEILLKINTLWAKGEFTDSQKEELDELARQNANPEQSYAPLKRQVESLFENMQELAAEIKAIKEMLANPEEPEEPLPEEYPEYKQPLGGHDAYHKGDKITSDGKRYICNAPEGVAVVWSPTQYPAYWQLVE